MADDALQIPGSNRQLEGVSVTTPAGAPLFREGVVVSDPTTAAARQAVMNTLPYGNEYASLVRVVSNPPNGVDTAGRSRVSARTTLFDGKILGADDTFKWNTVGTGTASYSGNTVDLAVTSGQYLVRQSKLFCQYFSGKEQCIEATHINFENETGVVKRVGYFSSSAVAPYSATLDGAWIEADGTTYRLITSNAGTETHNIPWTSWDAYSEISAYDWSKFTVTEIDFLWLGGAGLRLFMIIDGEFKLVHTIGNHAGYESTLIMASPNQPIRYEIRSTTGSGNIVSVCSQVSSEGSSVEEGNELSIFNSTAVACNSAGTIYALKGVRKTATYKNAHITIESFGGAIVSPTADSGMLLLLLAPTLSADLTWATNSKIEEGTAAAGQTVTAATGRLLATLPLVSGGSFTETPRARLRSLQINVDNTPGNIILAYIPYTANQSFAGAISLTEY